MTYRPRHRGKDSRGPRTSASVWVRYTNAAILAVRGKAERMKKTAADKLVNSGLAEFISKTIAKQTSQV